LLRFGFLQTRDPLLKIQPHAGAFVRLLVDLLQLCKLGGLYRVNLREFSAQLLGRCDHGINAGRCIRQMLDRARQGFLDFRLPAVKNFPVRGILFRDLRGTHLVDA